MGSSSPSPANSPFSNIEKLPESSVRFDLFSSQMARRGRAFLAPYRDVLGRQILLQDGNHSRLVLVNRHWLGYRVLEEVIKGVGGDIALLDGVASAIDTAAVALAETAGAGEVRSR